MLIQPAMVSFGKFIEEDEYAERVWLTSMVTLSDCC
jgi:hypothetical protein